MSIVNWGDIVIVCMAVAAILIPLGLGAAAVWMTYRAEARYRQRTQGDEREESSAQDGETMNVE